MITVTFTPSASGTRSASLAINDNASGSPQTVSLTGAGVPPATPPGSYSVQLQATSGNDVHTLSLSVHVQ